MERLAMHAAAKPGEPAGHQGLDHRRRGRPGAAGGQNLDAMRETASSAASRPMPLAAAATCALVAQDRAERDRVASTNGSRWSHAHWDHFGTARRTERAPDADASTTAPDNASGCAG
jgi:hypothetical protein